MWAYSLIICLLILSFNCNKQDDAAKGEKIAKIGDKIIYKSDLDAQIDKYMSQIPAGQMSEEERAKIRQQSFDQLKENEITKAILLANATDEEKAKGSDEKVNEYLTQIRSNFPDSQSFAQRLEQNGTTLEKLKTDIRDQMVIEPIMARITADVDSMPPDSLKAYYDAHQDQFQAQEQYRASHILIKTDTTDTDATRETKKKKLAGILAEVRKGKDFAALAKAHSDCPSGKNGGDLQFFSLGQMVKPFEDAVVALKINEISDVVETQFGYHIIKLTDHKTASTMPFDEVKGSITNQIKNQRFMDWLEVQKKELDVIDYTQQPKTE